MAALALVISIAAVVVTGVSVLVAWRSARASARSADAAAISAREAQEAGRRDRTPRLVVEFDHGDNPEITYTVRNEGPQDLDSVVFHAPEPGDGVQYAVAKVGQPSGPSYDMGPLRLGEQRSVLVVLGGNKPERIPVRIECTAGTDTWAFSVDLDPPATWSIYA